MIAAAPAVSPPILDSLVKIRFKAHRDISFLNLGETSD